MPEMQEQEREETTLVISGDYDKKELTGRVLPDPEPALKRRDTSLVDSAACLQASMHESSSLFPDRAGAGSGLFLHIAGGRVLLRSSSIVKTSWTSPVRVNTRGDADGLSTARERFAITTINISNLPAS